MLLLVQVRKAQNLFYLYHDSTAINLLRFDDSEATFPEVIEISSEI